nr:uncharacterized protein LOC113829412 [Penaeus vannamei]
MRPHLGSTAIMKSITVSVLAVCGGQGPEEEEDFTTFPSANETDLPPVTPTRFTAAKDTQEAPLLEEEPYFDASMTATYTGYLGKTATLTCIVHAAKNDKSVSWIRGRDLRILTVGGYTYTTDLRFEAFHQPHSTEWTLRIKSVQLRDQGGYECQIATKPIRTYHVFLKVVDIHKKFKRALSSITACQHEAALNPEPSELPFTGLNTHRVPLVKNLWKAARLPPNCVSIPEPTVEVVGAPDIYVNTASMINLTCVVHHAPYPPEDITWYHGNQVLYKRTWYTVKASE